MVTANLMSIYLCVAYTLGIHGKYGCSSSNNEYAKERELNSRIELKKQNHKIYFCILFICTCFTLHFTSFVRLYALSLSFSSFTFSFQKKKEIKRKK